MNYQNITWEDEIAWMEEYKALRREEPQDSRIREVELFVINDIQEELDMLERALWSFNGGLDSTCYL